MHPDHLNTPRLVADATGTTVWRWDQAEPFGASPADEDPDANTLAFDLPLRLPGQRYDAETGLHYNYFRDYDPSFGRYAESDPIGLRGGSNTYAYTRGHPLTQVDPLGLFAFHRHWDITVSAMSGIKCDKLSLLSLAWKTAYTADVGTQGVMDSHRHSMCAPFQPYAGHCSAKIESFIANEMSKCTVDGLANALHATQDGFSSSHDGQTWDGGRWGWWPGWGHLHRDVVVPNNVGKEATKASRDLIERFIANCGCCDKSSTSK